MSYTVEIKNFSGPLDLLLQLIESEKLKITSIALTQVTEPFIKRVEEHRGRLSPEELTDFLLIAAKLVYLKSRVLVPSFFDAELEQGPDLETQLRIYKAFVEAAHRLDAMVKAGKRSWSRIKRPLREPVAAFVPPVGVSAKILHDLYQHSVERLLPLLRLPQAAMEHVVTIEEKIQALSTRLRKALHTSFHSFLSEARDRAEAVVSFLALLELMKRRSVKVEQPTLFHDIRISSV